MQADGGVVLHADGLHPRQGLPRHARHVVIALAHQFQGPGGIEALHQQLLPGGRLVGEGDFPGKAALVGQVAADAGHQRQVPAADGVQHRHREGPGQITQAALLGDGHGGGGAEQRLVHVRLHMGFALLGLAQHHRQIERAQQQKRRQQGHRLAEDLPGQGGLPVSHVGQLLSWQNGSAFKKTHAGGKTLRAPEIRGKGIRTRSSWACGRRGSRRGYCPRR